ncbi:homogentisate phytyltransferase [Synechocystis sp. PCC 7509]|uniref:homogentisate phytyltransferase n=1 Tax=Synechocystis sp. PCC 7509 TaxID=927677 RepID=UPI0002AB9B38|nr:homogentisate phytyltransferase [Synechocystis sp. PCC 7509]
MVLNKDTNRSLQSNKLAAFWQFSRPHTIIGTSLSVWGVYAIALARSQSFALSQSLNTTSVLSILATWLACLCGNIYIVGLNQLEDVAIDKINKPDLPLASGEFSLATGKLIVIVTGILSLLLAGLQSPYLLGMVAISLIIGTAYSLPPIRLKRFPFWAALCIFTVRGAVVNLGLYLHFTSSFTIPATVWALTIFVIVFTVAIAIFKDIPDLEGDRQYQISTFTIALGQERVFNLARWIITICYVGMLVAAVFWLPSINSIFLISTHLGLLVLLWWRSFQVDLLDKIAIASFYQFIWKLFFLEYLIFPAACLLG